MSTDTVDAGPQLAERLHAFFATKTSCDVDGTMAYFAPDSLTYIDATLGWVFDSHAALRSVFEQYMPNWGPPARSYATRVLANGNSALVHMVDTPELFGGELLIYDRGVAETTQPWKGGSPHSAHHRGRCKPTRCSRASQPTSAASSARR